MIEGEPKDNRIHKDFSYGKKIISVDINKNDQTASVRFGTREGWWRKKKIGETTVIFLLADSFIQEIANRDNQTICLIFGSSDINLRVWARTRENDLGFDSVEPEDPESYRITVKKTYFPQEPSGDYAMK